MYHIVVCIFLSFSLPPSSLSFFYRSAHLLCSHFYQGENLLFFLSHHQQ
ncbi:hypothetical protein GcM1_c11254o12 [Golovinomyces cichoracearum]|uniref:Uncharacterized protein n=1 Tax=Golovinomyces cichoracearum TaxID=62708 RepID=A0A420IQI4_9PEZI|nr:hypothetical protein GcM1_c11254o12 [Golovinomyces cichoracearum]